MGGMRDVLDENDNLVRRNRELRQMGTGEDQDTKDKAVAAKASGVSSSPAPTSGAPDKFNVPRKDGESMDDHAARVAVARKAWVAKNGPAPTGD